MCTTTSWFFPRSARSSVSCSAMPFWRASEQRPHAGGERADLGLRRRADDVALGRNELSRQGVLEHRQAALLEQRVVAVDLGKQSLLRGDREHLRGGMPRSFADDFTWRSISASTSSCVLELVPQAVDLVQDHDAARLRRRVVARQVLVPHVEVGLGDAGVGRKDEQHGVRVGKQRERELGLGADCVQSRRVQNDEALLQQRMREVDHRMAPARDLDRALDAAARRRAPPGNPRLRPTRRIARLDRDTSSPATRGRALPPSGPPTRDRAVRHPLVSVVLEFGDGRFACSRVSIGSRRIDGARVAS